MCRPTGIPHAIALLEKAHAAAPGNTRLTATLGNLYIRSGKAAEALALVGKDKTAASSIDMLNVQAAAQMALDQKAQARDTYRQIIKLDPSVLAARRAADRLAGAGWQLRGRPQPDQGRPRHQPAQLSALL